MIVDLEAMRSIAQELYIPMIVRKHGAEGAEALRKVLEALRILYRRIEPEAHDGPIVVFSTVQFGGRPLPESEAIEIIDPMTLSVDSSGDSFVVQVLPNGRYLLWNSRMIAPEDLAEQAVVYVYKDRSEFFYAKDEMRMVTKFVPGFASMFAIPTFGELRHALEHYRVKMIRNSTCEIFSETWSDSNRLFFKNGPERVMRKSLTQFLLSTLRGDVEVRPEQNVDESHPVDIKVTWSLTNRLALIEIKWLGTPRYADGRIGQRYTDQRARDGAQQLADYLDENRRRAPDYVTRGYLVIIDGRRAGLNETTADLSVADALHYESREIAFNPRFEVTRTDFETPIRMFAVPVCR